MNNPTLDFWVSVGSTYSFLTVMRINRVETIEEVCFRWRPFSVGEIMMEQNNIPFRGKPVKMAYMWRDIERRAQFYGIPARIPAPYPLTSDLANKVAVVGEQEGWCKKYIQATYRRWFQDGQEAGSEPNLSQSLREIGQDPVRVIKAAETDDIEQLYAAATQEAKSLGVFGSPTFVVDGEVFWGDDRLEDAIKWCKLQTRQ
jgi:2-hydroxychromene-2-carboxylate isomerase